MPKNLLILLAVLCLPFVYSCRKDKVLDDPSAKLEFSTDTVLFDTVFTKLGGTTGPRSVNKRFTIRNPHNQTLRTDIFLAGGSASPFRINIDGQPKLSVSGYELRAQDSAYIFVEVTVDPNNATNPLIIQDSIVFTANGNRQDIKLVAWGQDAYYMEDSVLGCNISWLDKQKPYVIYNSVLVPEGCKLTIGPGVKVHSSVNSVLYVNGTLEILGTDVEPVILQGARLEQAYKDIAGQWWGIRMLPQSRDNIIRYAEIKNGVRGVEVDSLQNNGALKLRISNSIVKNMAGQGIACFTARVEATNVLVSNCGQFTFLGTYGGDYQLKHCTFANYGGAFLRNKPSFGLSNEVFPGTPPTAYELHYTIQNCIIGGGLKEELALFLDGPVKTGARTLENSILKTEMNNLNKDGNKLNLDPKFENMGEQNFELDTLSPAKDAGKILVPAVLIDLKGKTRDASPDIGAYERFE